MASPRPLPSLRSTVRTLAVAGLHSWSGAASGTVHLDARQGLLTCGGQPEFDATGVRVLPDFHTLFHHKFVIARRDFFARARRALRLLRSRITEKCNTVTHLTSPHFSLAARYARSSSNLAARYARFRVAASDRHERLHDKSSVVVVERHTSV